MTTIVMSFPVQSSFNSSYWFRMRRIMNERVEGRRLFAAFRLHVVRLSCQIIFWWSLSEIAASDFEHIIALCFKHFFVLNSIKLQLSAGMLALIRICVSLSLNLLYFKCTIVFISSYQKPPYDDAIIQFNSSTYCYIFLSFTLKSG